MEHGVTREAVRNVRRTAPCGDLITGIQDMRILIVGDSIAKLSALRTMLEPHFMVSCQLLGEAASGKGNPEAIVVSASP